MDSKHALYPSLVEARKRCVACAGQLRNASSINDGQFDSDHVGPYSQWQGNLDAKLLVVAQDFADIAGFLKYRGWAGHDVPTNLALVELVREAGIEIQRPKLGTPDDRLFFTNAVLCMKSGSTGGRQQAIPTCCFRNCSPFLKRTIELVSPRVVVTLGRKALDAARWALQIPEDGNLADLVGVRIGILGSATLVPLYHPSPTVLNTHRSFDLMREDWRSLRPLLHAPRP